MRRVRVGRLLAAAVYGLVFLAAVAPAADLYAFGIHDHVAEATGESAHPSAFPAPSAAPATHHCDLQTNPGQLEPPADLAAPILIAAIPREDRILAAVQRPFIPFNPPRL